MAINRARRAPDESRGRGATVQPGSESIPAQLLQVEPLKAELMKAEPLKAEPLQAEPLRAAPVAGVGGAVAVASGPDAAASEDLTHASALVTRASRTIVAAFLLAAVVWGLVARSYGARAVAAQTAGPSSSGEPSPARLTELSLNGWAWCWAFAAVGVGLLVLHLIDGAKGYGVFRPLIGADRRFSTSLTQLGLWTLLITTSFGWLLIKAGLTDVSVDTLLPSSRWDQYLLLLGGPFAAAVLAKGIVTYKVSQGTLQKTEPAATELRQVAADDGGGTDLVDAQYLLFNLVAQVYFVIALVQKGVLPEMPSTLLAMTSLTAATYVGSKAARANAPVITSISPKTVSVGTEVTVLGSNFDPSGSADPRRVVTISISGLAEAIPVAPGDFTDTRVWFTVPPGVTAGKHQTLQLTSTAGVATIEYDVEVV